MPRDPTQRDPSSLERADVCGDGVLLAMDRVIVESPLAGDFKRNRRYAQLCCLDCLINRGEAPFASHLIYTQVLDDEIPDQRALGIEAGIVWGKGGDIRAVYQDLGISKGMSYGIAAAEGIGQRVEYRNLPQDLLALLDSDGPIGNPTKAF
jgi:hypothetical protein